MKKAVFIILFVAGILLIINYVYNNYSSESDLSGPCSNPVTYKIGNLSSIYNIDKPELKNLLNDIAEAWSTAIGKNLFKYSEHGRVSVNLIYDKQQRFVEKERSASTRIRLEKQSYKAAEKKLLSLKASYEHKKKEYENLINAYNRLSYRLAAKTGRQRKVLNQQLQARKEEINKKRDELNDFGQRINEKISASNRIALRIDDLLSEYNKSYGSPKEFNQGKYEKNATGEAINIYSFSDIDELKLVLAHEMGHALGLGHVQNAKSIMFYLMQNQPRDTLHFTNEDIKALKKRCEIDVL